eukprot:COSAG01_NODE_33807_length_558_cov_1.026144_1_plen_37_part_01
MKEGVPSVHCGPASQPLPSRAAKLGTRIDARCVVLVL